MGFLKDSLYQEKFLIAVTRLLQLGWPVIICDLHGQSRAPLDFSWVAERWLEKLSTTGPLLGRINLGVYTGTYSHLLALKAKKGFAVPGVPESEEWQSPCRARQDSLELHFFVLPPTASPPPSHYEPAIDLMVYGEGGLATLPPSLDPELGGCWQWLSPPWETSPPPAPSSLLAFLRAHRREGEGELEKILSWESLFPLISDSPDLLRALMTPYPSLEAYYRHVLVKALDSGLQDPNILFSLLCHAPLGDAAQNPLRRQWLKQLLAGRQTGPEKFSFMIKREKEPAPQDSLPSSRPESAFLTPGSNSSGPTPALLEGESLKVNRLLHLLTYSQSVGKVNREWGEKGEISFHYAELPQRSPSLPEPRELEELIRAFFTQHPSLRGDAALYQMFYYCLKNYVLIDPDLCDLPLLEQFQRAAEMAHSFLGKV